MTAFRHGIVVATDAAISGVRRFFRLDVNQVAPAATKAPDNVSAVCSPVNDADTEPLGEIM